MKKKILIIGNGAKEFALAKKLSEKHEVYVTPATDTLKEFVTCLDIREDNVTELVDFVMENGIDMTIPISEKVLKTNIVDVFNQNNLKIFGSSAKANSIIFDKALAKKVLYKLRIPTPKFGIFEKQNMVYDYVKNQKVPFVIKTDDSNSATVYTSFQLAKPCIDLKFIERNPKVIIEDYIYGIPFSFYTITDGYKALPIGSSVLYKHSLDGGGGQLTTGMGACSPNYNLSIENEYFLMDNVIYPTLDYLEIEGNPYSGVLGVNGIIAEDGKISILGWQSFMQDCDAQSVLEILDEDLYELFYSCVVGAFSDEIENIKLKNMYATSLVLSCTNSDNKENIIKGLPNLDEDTKITFFPNTAKNRYLEYEANKGSVMMITTSASTVSSAIKKMYSEAREIEFKSMKYRTDICKARIS